jgi:hypothetical protein
MYKLVWEDNIKIDPKETEFEVVDWIHLGQNTVQWRVLLNTVTKISIK